MTLQFREVSALTYRVSKYDADVVISFTGSGDLLIPKDDGSIPIGMQVAVQATTAAVLVKGDAGVTVGCPVNPIVRPFQTGVMVKQDANFWLLSLGSGGGGGGSVPLPPVLKNLSVAPGALGVAWDAPLDPGASAISSYAVETSLDGLVYQVAALTDGKTLATSLGGLLPEKLYVRVKALNGDGFSDPSNVMSATPGPSVLTAVHSASGVFTITNYNAKYTYTATGTGGDPTITADKVSTTVPETDITLKATYGADTQTLILHRRQYTYYWKADFKSQNQYVHAWVQYEDCHQSNCPPCPDQSGCIGACSNTRVQPTPCNHNEGYNICTQEKNDPPDGYIDQYGEWARVGE